MILSAWKYLRERVLRYGTYFYGTSELEAHRNVGCEIDRVNKMFRVQTFENEDII